MRSAGALAAALCVTATLAATALAVVNGSPDNGRHPYVGAAIGEDGTLCSGALVSATVFVTAAHCFPDGAVVLVSVDESLFDRGPAGAVPGVVHDAPGYAPAGGGLARSGRDDLAVVSLLGPLDAARYAQLPAVGYDDSLPRNQQVEIVGYGAQQLEPPGVGYRFVAPAKIVPGGGAAGADFLKISSSPGHGGATCSGDSGGPDLQAGTDLMLAIGSYGPSATCRAVDYSQRMDTPDAVGFVQSFLATT